MPDAPTYEQLLAHIAVLEAVIAAQADRIAELERRLGGDSSNSSRPPSSDAPWAKQPAPKRSSRVRSGRKPGKQPGSGSGSGSGSRALVADPDEIFEVAPARCAGCDGSLHGAPEAERTRRQVADVSPPPKVTEYQLVSRRCSGCGHLNAPTADDRPRRIRTPARPGTDPAPAPTGGCIPEPVPGRDLVPVPVPEPVAEAGRDLLLAWVLGAGSPVRIGPGATAAAALLTCGHYLPVGRAGHLFGA